MIRFVAAFLLLCGAAVAQPAVHDTLTIGVAQFPPDMHPDFVPTDAKLYLLYLGQRPVTQRDLTGRVVCRLCTEVPSLANGRVTVTAAADGTRQMDVLWTLRDDLVWADGVPVTTADAALAFAVGKSVDPTNAMDRLDIVDAHNFRVHRIELRYDFDSEVLPASNFLLPEHVEGPIFRAASGSLDYAQRSLYNRAPGTAGLWLGPYRVTSYNPSSLLTAEPNPFWHGPPVGFRHLAVRLIESTPALEANLLSGDIDVMASELGFPLTQLIRLDHAHADRFQVVYRTAGYIEQMAVALAHPPLDDRRVRQAILMGIDRGTMVAKLFEGHTQVAGELLAPDEVDFDPDIHPWPYDPAAAKKLLAEAGYTPGADGILVRADGTRLSIPLVTIAGNTARELEESVIQSQMKPLGIEITLRNQPARVMFGQTLKQRDFSGFVLYAHTPAPDTVPVTFLGSAGIPSAANGYFGGNYSGYANPDMDTALTAARQELDPAKRRTLWRRIHELMATDLPILPLFYYTVAYVQPRWLQGEAPPPLAASATAWIEQWRPR